jgi:tRNA A37 methylthiotransferase MiaB
MGVMKIYVESEGCTRRLLEMARMESFFKLNDFQMVSRPEDADCIVFGSCAFKEEEELYAFSRLLKLQKYKARIIVYGCLPNISPSKYKEEFDFDYCAPKDIDRIDDLFDNIRHKFSSVPWPNQLSKSDGNGSWRTATRKFFEKFELSPEFGSKALGYLKDRIGPSRNSSYLFISRGCLGKCSYCAIKNAVGPVRSKAIETIIEEFNQGVQAGFHEFFIIGDDVGAYGQDIKRDLTDLLRAFLEKVDDAEQDGLKNAENIKFHIEELHPKWLIRFEEGLLPLLSSDRVASLFSLETTGY